MTQDLARSVLRLIALVFIMVGFAMTARTLLSLIGFSQALNEIPNTVLLQMSGNGHRGQKLEAAARTTLTRPSR